MERFGGMPRSQKGPENSREEEDAHSALPELEAVALKMQDKVNSLPKGGPELLQGEASEELRKTIAEVTEGIEG